MSPEPSDPGAPSRIGILGGTFDPIHIGHLVAAVEARFRLRLDRMLLVVANQPWQKVEERAVTPAKARLAAVAAAVEGVAGIEASSLEIERGGPSFTADTVAELRRRHPDAELFLVVGEDVAASLHTWHRAERLPEEVTLVVVRRGGMRPAPAPAGWRGELLDIPALEISSSELRRRLAVGEPVEFLIPEPAIGCIRSLGLYAEDR